MVTTLKEAEALNHQIEAIAEHAQHLNLVFVQQLGLRPRHLSHVEILAQQEKDHYRPGRSK